MALRSKVLTFVLLAALISACGDKTPKPSTGFDSTENSAPDFRAMLTRNDHVETCVVAGNEDITKRLGEGWIPETEMRFGCECIEESTLQALARVNPGKPVLHNAVLQLVMNLDVVGVVLNEQKHPGNIDAFYAYLKTHGPTELGFNDEEFLETLNEASEVANSRSPDDILSNVKACGAAADALKARYPDIDFEKDPHYGNRMTALRRLEFDQGIELSGLAVALTSRYPKELCITLSMHPQGETKSRQTEEEAELGCEEFIIGMEASTTSLAPYDKIVAVRIALGHYYIQRHRTTAEQNDGLYYLLEHHEKFGWTKPQLKSITRQLVRETDAKLWRDLQSILETGDLPQS